MNEHHVTERPATPYVAVTRSVPMSGIPVAGPVPRGIELAELALGVLPAGRYATVVHVGHPDTLEGATGRLLRWSADAGLTFEVRPGERGGVRGCRLESYLTDPRIEPDTSRWETELAFRLADDHSPTRPAAEAAPSHV